MTTGPVGMKVEVVADAAGVPIVRKCLAVELPETALTPVVARTDVQRGVYEGGLKVWECAVDLVRYLADRQGRDPLVRPGSRVLEIGCGHGLPGAWAATKGASVLFQDLNPEVLLHVTMPTVAQNCGPCDPGSPAPGCRFVSGDWGAVAAALSTAHESFDLVLSSETIYAVDALPALVHLIRTALAPGGVAVLANKRFYFGVGGGTRAFEAEAARQGLSCTVVSVLEDRGSNIREICIVSHAAPVVGDGARDSAMA